MAISGQARGTRGRGGLAAAALALAAWAAGCAQSAAGQAGDGAAPVSTAAAQVEAREPVMVETVTHRGIDDAVQISAAGTRLVVVPAWAGRLSVLDFGTGNLLYQNPQIDGAVVKPQDGWAPWDGNATDPVRLQGDQRQSQFKGLWLHPYPTVDLLPAGVRVASAVSPDAQLAATKAYTLAPDGRRVDYTMRVASHAGESTRWIIQERALMVPDYVVLPLAAADNAWETRDGTSVQPTSHAEQVGDFLVLRPGVEKGAGLAVRLRAGWAGVVRGEGAMLMTFPLDPRGEYPLYGGSHILPWLNPGSIEVEPLSPVYALAPNGTAELAQTWYWLELPADVRAGGPGRVGQWLEQQARALALPQAER